MATATWATIEDVQAAWPDAIIDDTQLQRLLDAAQEMLERVAPALPEGSPIPSRYTEALIMHTRELWRAGERDGDAIGVSSEGYVVRARPITPLVLQMLGPKVKVIR